MPTPPLPAPSFRFRAFGPDTVITHVPESRSINVQRNGYFMMNPITAKHLGLKEGGYVRLFQDENEPADWYIAATVDKFKGFRVRQRTDAKGTKRVVFQSMSTAKRLLDSTGTEGLTSGSMLVGVASSFSMDGMDLFPIITSSLKVRASRKTK
jgi:hypothetical protein